MKPLFLTRRRTEVPVNAGYLEHDLKFLKGQAAATECRRSASSILAPLAELFPQAENEKRVDDQIAKVPVELVCIDQAVRDFVS